MRILRGYERKICTFQQYRYCNSVLLFQQQPYLTNKVPPLDAVSPEEPPPSSGASSCTNLSSSLPLNASDVRDFSCNEDSSGENDSSSGRDSGMSDSGPAPGSVDLTMARNFDQETLRDVVLNFSYKIPFQTKLPDSFKDSWSLLHIIGRASCKTDRLCVKFLNTLGQTAFSLKVGEAALSLKGKRHHHINSDETFPFLRCFDLVIYSLSNGFHVKINGCLYAISPHRNPPSFANELSIEGTVHLHYIAFEHCS